MATSTRLSTQEVADAAGVTYRQIDYWCRIGLIRPSRTAAGSGSRRGFTRQDAAVVKVIGQVAKLVALSDLGELVGFLDDLPLDLWPFTKIILGPRGDVWITDQDAPKVGIHVDLSLVFD